MVKILFFLLISFIFSYIIVDDSDVNQYNAKQSKIIELKDKTACVCFELDKNLEKDENFYLQLKCEDKDSSISYKLNYNFLYQCKNKYKCEKYYLNNYKYDNKPTIHEESSGFHYEYKLMKSFNEANAILVQYNNFHGKTLTLEITSLSVKTALTLIIAFVVVGFVLIVVIVIIVICVYRNKKKAKEMNAQFQSSYVCDNPTVDPITAQENLLE